MSKKNKKAHQICLRSAIQMDKVWLVFKWIIIFYVIINNSKQFISQMIFLLLININVVSILDKE